MNRLTILELEDYIRSIDVSKYRELRNYLGESTELSEYITRGFITLPHVRNLLLEQNTPDASYKLINELAWREYWHLVWQTRGDDIFEYIRPLSQPRRQGIPLAVLYADTGIKALDDGIRQLQQNGYIHNHMRLWIAGLICNVAQCDWRIGADWMHSYLIDGDYASNHLSWQWVAGSYTGQQYLPQQDNINTYSRTLQSGTYLDNTYDFIKDMPIPEQLLAIEPILPKHNGELPKNTISIEELSNSASVLLYSPWTLDPNWLNHVDATRVLLLDSDSFTSEKYSQNVYDSITWFSNQIKDLKILIAAPKELAHLESIISRKQYTGISDWPGQFEQAERIYPEVPIKFYPSFSAFWKQATKH